MRPTKPTLIKPGDTGTEVHPARGKYFTLEEMQAHVGGYIQIVFLPKNEQLIINEHGKDLDLPENPFATLIAAGGSIRTDDCINGNALFLPAPWVEPEPEDEPDPED